MSLTLKDPVSEGWTPTSSHRSGGIEIKQLFQRDSGVGGFEMTVVRFGGEPFHSPPHKHAFDQIRIGLEGVTSYGKVDLAPRVLGYFPAGTTYGPQDVAEPSLQTILQFDGTGDGVFCPLSALDEASARMRGRGGVFDKGWFTPPGGEKKEAWLATFEEARGWAPQVQPARYPEPVFMNIDAFPWRSGDVDGVKRKTIGRFGDVVTTIEVVALPKGKAFKLGKAGHPVIGFLIEGSVRVNGQTLGRHSGVLAEENDVAEVVSAADDTEIVVITQPDWRKSA